MEGIRDDPRLLPRIRAPKEEHDRRRLFIELRDHAVGEDLPAHPLVAVGLMLADGQHGVQHQHALLRPIGQLAVTRIDEADVIRELFEDVFERRRRLHPALNGKAETVRLAGAVVGILADDHGFAVFERGIAERVEDIVHIRIDHPRAVFVRKERTQLQVIILFEFFGEDRIPVVADIDHILSPAAAPQFCRCQKKPASAAGSFYSMLIYTQWFRSSRKDPRRNPYASRAYCRR